MKKNKVSPLVLSTFIFLLQLTNSHAQNKQLVWSKAEPHSCYLHLFISVVNMGYSKANDNYMWGVKITNKYKIPVSFRYQLSVGGENLGGTKANYEASPTLEPGESVTNGSGYINPITFKSSSDAWTVMIGDVCFGGMRCGGADGCYAYCDHDKDNPTPNQPCGLKGSASPNDPKREFDPSGLSGTQKDPNKEEDETPDIGETTNWIRDDKKMEIVMGKTEKGIYWKEKTNKEYLFFKKLPSGAYRYEVGKDYYILQFVSATKLQFSENGTVTNHYNLVAEEDDGISKVRSGIWIDGNKVKITVQENGLIYHTINSVDDGSPFFRKISATEYRRDNADGITFCTLKLKADKKLHYTCNDKPDSYVAMGELTFLSAEEEKKTTENNLALNSEWKDIKTEINRRIILVNDDNIIVKLKGIPNCWLFNKTAANTYERKYDDGSKEVHKLINNRFTVETFDNNGISTSKNDIGKYELVSSGIAENVPNSTTQSKPVIEIDKGWWFYKGITLFSKLLFVSKGDTLLAGFYSSINNHRFDTYKYIKTGPFVYTYKSKDIKNNDLISVLKYLNDTTLSISCQYINLNTLSYYTRPAAPPIVKQENKPAPITENKTTNKGSVSGKWYVDYFGLAYGDYSITIEELGDELKMKFMLEPNPLGGQGIVNTSGTIVTAKKTSTFKNPWKDAIGAPAWEGIYPENGIMIPCYWIYIGTVGKEQLVMQPKNSGWRKFYRVRHSQGF